SRHLRESNNVIGLGAVHGIEWHLRKGRVLRVLHHRYAAGFPDRPKSRGVVAQSAGQDHANTAGPAADRSRAQHWINGGTRIVFTRTLAQEEPGTVDEKVAIRRRYVNSRLLQYVAVLGEDC